MAILYICHEKGSKILDNFSEIVGFPRTVIAQVLWKNLQLCGDILYIQVIIFTLWSSFCNNSFPLLTGAFFNKSEMFVISNMQQLQQRHSASAVLAVLESTHSLIQPLEYCSVLGTSNRITRNDGPWSLQGNMVHRSTKFQNSEFLKCCDKNIKHGDETGSSCRGQMKNCFRNDQISASMIRAHVDALKSSTSRHILSQAWEESESGLKCCEETSTQGDR